MSHIFTTVSRQFRRYDSRLKLFCPPRKIDERVRVFNSILSSHVRSFSYRLLDVCYGKHGIGQPMSLFLVFEHVQEDLEQFLRNDRDWNAPKMKVLTLDPWLRLVGTDYIVSSSRTLPSRSSMLLTFSTRTGSSTEISSPRTSSSARTGSSSSPTLASPGSMSFPSSSHQR